MEKRCRRYALPPQSKFTQGWPGGWELSRNGGTCVRSPCANSRKNAETRRTQRATEVNQGLCVSLRPLRLLEVWKKLFTVFTWTGYVQVTLRHWSSNNKEQRKIWKRQRNTARSPWSRNWRRSRLFGGRTNGSRWRGNSCAGAGNCGSAGSSCSTLPTPA